MNKITIVLVAIGVVANMQMSAQAENRPSLHEKSGFAVSSSAVKSGGPLPSYFTGDGKGVSMPLEWTNVPAGTKCFALNLWHSAPDRIKSYWIIYNIPANVHSLPEDVKGIGVEGYNDKKKTGYDPMRSKGPGVKKYNLTIYALSAKPTFSTKKVQRSDLLKAIKGITLAQCTLKYTYERKRINSSKIMRKDSESPK